MINLFNLVILLAIMIPNIIYALSVKDIKPKRREKFDLNGVDGDTFASLGESKDGSGTDFVEEQKDPFTSSSDAKAKLEGAKAQRTALEELLYADDEETPVLLNEETDLSSVVRKDARTKKKHNDVDLAKKIARWKALNFWVGVTEAASRIACVVLMLVPFGVLEFGFSNKENFIIYVFGNIIFIVLYWMVWSKFLKKRRFKWAVLVSVLSALIFLLVGLTLDHWWLALAALIYGVSHTGIVLESIWEE